MSIVTVNAGMPYQVRIEAGSARQLGEYVGDAARVAIVHASVMADEAGRLAGRLSDLGRTPVLVEVPAGEQAKTSQTLADCWDALAEGGLTRNDLVVGLGGGATTDLAGFVAATWLRGVGYVSIPTTVLAMVDAAVGGKTGINVPAGKNLVGAFYEPRAVLCDLDLLVELPSAEVSSGLGEVIKAGFIADPRILELVRQDPAEARDVTSIRFAELVRRAIEVKAAVVSADLRERTSVGDDVGREKLNYGHTLAHAIEAHEHFTVRHGEAVAVGMVFMAEVSARLLGLSPEAVELHRGVLASVGLPTGYQGASWDELRPTMSLDKKARGASLRLVGLPEIGRVTMIADAPEEVLAESYAAISG